MIETIVAYLARNVSPAEIASIVGCTESYISQVKERPEFPALLESAQHKVKIAKGDQERETKYANLEDTVIHHVKEQMPFAEFGQLTKLMDTLIKRKQVQSVQVGSMIVNNDNRVQTVVLSLPQAAIPEIHLNNNQEVVGIGDKSLAPLSSGGVRGIFALIEEKKKQEDAKRLGRTLENEF